MSLRSATGPICNYAISRCGFEGDKVLFIDHSVDPIAIEKLKKLGFILPVYEPFLELEGKAAQFLGRGPAGVGAFRKS